MGVTGQEVVEPLLAEALACAQRAEWEAAFRAVDRAVSSAPSSSEVHLVRGRVLRMSGADQGAQIRAFRRASECEAEPAPRAEALREYGLALVPIGRHREAAVAFDDAAQLMARGGPDRERPTRVLRLAELADLASKAHETTGDVERAYERHRAAEPHYREGLSDLAAFYAREAALLERLGRWTELLQGYRRLVETDPDHVLFAQPDVRRTSALTKRLRDLLGGINEVLGEHRHDLVARVFKAGFFFRLGRYRHAERLLERAIAQGPEHFYPYHLLGKVRLKVGRASAALEALERAVPLAPLYHDLERDLALALELAGRGEEALAVYRRIETRWPERRESLERAAELCQRLGHVEEAYEAYRRLAASEAEPRLADEERLAALATELARPAQALGHLEQAIELARAGTHERASLRFQRAAALVALGRPGEALEELDGVIERYRARGQGGIVRAAVLEKAALLVRHLERPEEALALAEGLVEADGTDVEALAVTGDALSKLRRFTESVERYARAADQRMAEALMDEGARLVEGAQFQKAIGKLFEAFRKTPATWEVYYSTAAAYARLGEARPAARYLEAAAERQPGAIKLMEQDRDFDAVREAPELGVLLARPGGGSA